MKSICVSLGAGVAGEWVRGLDLDFTRPVATGECDVFLCFSCGSVGGLAGGGG